MNSRAAIEETMTLAATRIDGHPGNVPNIDNFSSPDIGYKHCCEMLEKIRWQPMNDGKLSRWLGWIQCSVVSWGIATLEEMKDINKKHTGD